MKAKRLLSAIAAGVLACAMSFNVMAADSPSTGGVVKEATNATDKAGASVSIKIKTLPTEVQAVAEEVKKPEKVKEVLADKYVEGMYVMDVQEVVVEGDASQVQWPVTITFSVPGVVSTTKVAVLHYNGSAWEVVDSKAGTENVIVTGH